VATDLTASQSAEQNPLELSNQERLVQAPDTPIPPSDGLNKAFLLHILKSPLREIRTAGSVGGARSNPRAYPTWPRGALSPGVARQPLGRRRLCLSQPLRDNAETVGVRRPRLLVVHETFVPRPFFVVADRDHTQRDALGLGTHRPLRQRPSRPGPTRSRLAARPLRGHEGHFIIPR